MGMFADAVLRSKNGSSENPDSGKEDKEKITKEQDASTKQGCDEQNICDMAQPKLQVKLLEESVDVTELEREVNEFLETLDPEKIKDIRYQAFSKDRFNYYSAMVIYIG